MFHRTSVAGLTNCCATHSCTSTLSSYLFSSQDSYNKRNEEFKNLKLILHCKNSGVAVTPNWGVSELCTSDTTPTIEKINWGVSQGTWVVP